MITTQTARMLARYNRWSNDVFFKAVAELPPDEIVKPRQTLFGNIVHTLNHIYVIDDIFRAHLEARAHGYTARNTPEPPAFDDLRRRQRELDEWYVAWSDRQSDDTLQETVEFTFVGGGDGAMTRGQILMHVVNHTSYHRGFAGDLFFQIPGKRAPATDLTVYLRDVAPHERV
jgi:uncharacterized damage-inducible protein DinB